METTVGSEIYTNVSYPKPVSIMKSIFLFSGCCDCGVVDMIMNEPIVD